MVALCLATYCLPSPRLYVDTGWLLALTQLASCSLFRYRYGSLKAQLASCSLFSCCQVKLHG